MVEEIPSHRLFVTPKALRLTVIVNLALARVIMHNSTGSLLVQCALSSYTTPYALAEALRPYTAYDQCVFSLSPTQ